MIRRGFVLVCVLLMIAAAAACEKKDRGVATLQGKAPDFTLLDLDGKSVTLSGLKGKVVVLDFWATWCPPCRASIPDVEKLHQKFLEKGVVVLGISLDAGDWDSVIEFRDAYGMTYPILRGTEEVSQQYQVRTIPMFVIVDKEGVVRKRYIGSGSEEEIEKDLSELL